MKRDPRLRSRWWRLTHLYKILDKNGQLVTFKPSVVQLRILALLPKHFYWRILKYRQGGVTTLFCILYLDEALWTPGFSAGIIAHDQSTLDDIFQKVKIAFDNLPDGLKPTTRTNTVRMYRFESTFDGVPLNSSIYVALKVRGGTNQAIHVTERAYIEGEKSTELEAGAKQTVPIGGRITEETTANGLNEYHDAFTADWDAASDDPMDYGTMFFAWHEDPQYTLPGELGDYTQAEQELKDTVLRHYNTELTDGQVIWYFWKMKQLVAAARESEDKVTLSGRQLMMQEYPSHLDEAFQSGAGNVFDDDVMNGYVPVNHIKEVPVICAEAKGEKWKMFKEVEAGRFYGMGVDPSDGAGDPAGIAIWDDNYEKVAEWHGRLRPDKLAHLAKEMAVYYNNAYIGIENNMLSCILELSKIYDNYYFTTRIDQKTQRKTKKMGWTTTGQSRDVMIDDFIMHFEEFTLKGLSKLTMKEMKTFVRKEGGKREHASGKHDDMLFADMIALQMIKNKDKSRAKRRVFVSKPGGL